MTRTYPASPHHARTPPSRAVGAARTTSSSGVKPNQASHHHDGAGKANAGSAPTTNAAVRPGTRGGSGPSWDRRHFSPNITAPDEDPAEHENSGIRCSGECFGTTPAQHDHD